VFTILLSVYYTTECLLYYWVFTILLSVYYTIEYLLYYWVFTILLGVYYTIECLLYYWVFTILLSVYYTIECLLYYWVFTILLRVYYTFECLLYYWGIANVQYVLMSVIHAYSVMFYRDCFKKLDKTCCKLFILIKFNTVIWQAVHTYLNLPNNIITTTKNKYSNEATNNRIQ